MFILFSLTENPQVAISRIQVTCKLFLVEMYVPSIKSVQDCQSACRPEENVTVPPLTITNSTVGLCNICDQCKHCSLGMLQHCQPRFHL